MDLLVKQQQIYNKYHLFCINIHTNNHITMIKIFNLAMILLLISGCKPKSNTDEAGNPAADIKQELAAPKKELKNIEAAQGKTPTETKLFDTYALMPRFEKLLGKEFDTFKADWNTESPVEYDGEVVYFYGCKKDNCKENRYLILIDVTLNTINIYNFKGGSVRAYEEDKNVIGLNDKVADYFDKINKEQKDQ